MYNQMGKDNREPLFTITALFFFHSTHLLSLSLFPLFFSFEKRSQLFNKIRALSLSYSLSLSPEFLSFLLPVFVSVVIHSFRCDQI
ncbi:hypothetical protein RchiOBHm_Chr5g0058751 [Rosa chinensis]|uniref:Uncharacterized protein n=1 Tax=Rosa chinensis TaxID=74649 RepID=A0A2P6QH76_ROSCH|nr:hypothetical protein RchiOBHm_Chr5g0058751 [Rosa chinensis]